MTAIPEQGLAKVVVQRGYKQVMQAIVELQGA